MLRLASSSGREEKFGAPLRTEIDLVTSIGNQLLETVDDQHQGMVRKVTDRLENTAVRIAFIGQVKAGKSTLVNAFARQPGFLPADVNPWTAVVTSMHFGMPNVGAMRARFRFFKEEEWERLAGRGGKLGELNDLVLSGYQRDELEDQLEQMKLRARNRLGDQFHHLLGKEHRFNDLSAEILRRYVCAGETPDQRLRGHAEGRFADLTKSADMYFAEGPFAIPTTVIDTPGTNDIFLVREEITCQVLEHADLHVVVMSAHQAMAKSDLSLMRMLHALDLRKLVVFVNRIDEVGDPASEAPKLDRHVRKMLQRDFPDAEIPVIVGSGWWGELAQQEDPHVTARETQKLRAFAEYLSRAGYSNSSDASLLEICSGLPRLTRTLAEMAASGPVGTWIQSAVTALNNVARSAKSAADLDARAISDTLERSRTDERSIAARRQRFTEQARRIENLVGRLEASTKRWQMEMEDGVERNWIELRASMEGALERFVNIETRSLRNGEAEKKNRVWTCDPTPLRRELHRDFVNGFAKSRQALIATLKAASEESQKILMEHEAADGEFLENLEDLRAVAPSAAPLAKIVAFDMEFSWWKDWWRLRNTMQARADSLAKIIRGEFGPICDELLKNGEVGLMQVSKAAMAQLNALHETALTMAQRRIAQIDELAQRLETAGDEALMGDVVSAERERVEEHNAVSQRIAGLIQQIESLSSEKVPAAATGSMA